jgi:tellurite methyltransferase
MLFDDVYSSEDWYYKLAPSEELESFLSTSSVPGGRALDLGCGEGRDSVALARHGYKVSAVDQAASGIEKLNRFAASEKLLINGIVEDATKFLIEENTYDLICCVTLLDHLPLTETREMVSKICAGLRPGGVLFSEVFTTADPGFSGGAQMSETAEFVRHYFSPGELQHLFRNLIPILYDEKVEWDTSHGKPHEHGVAVLIARREHT